MANELHASLYKDDAVAFKKIFKTNKLERLKTFLLITEYDAIKCLQMFSFLSSNMLHMELLDEILFEDSLNISEFYKILFTKMACCGHNNQTELNRLTQLFIKLINSNKLVYLKILTQIEFSKPIDYYVYDNYNLLEHSIIAKNPEAVIFFMKMGLDKKGNMPLLYLCLKNPSLDVFERLLVFGKDPNEKYLESNLVKECLNLDNSFSFISLLVQYGLFLNETNLKGESTLINMDTSELEYIQLFVKKGMNPNIFTNTGKLICKLMCSKMEESVKYLLQKNILINVIYENKNLLELAIMENCSSKICIMLIEKGLKITHEKYYQLLVTDNDWKIIDSLFYYNAFAFDIKDLKPEKRVPALLKGVTEYQKWSTVIPALMFVTDKKKAFMGNTKYTLS